MSTVCFVQIVLVALLCLCAAASLPYTPFIQYLTPNRGSIAGGTDLIIYGSGFARNGIEGQYELAVSVG